MKNEKVSFNINSTNACKGIALILLLWHHLFNAHPEFGFITFKVALLSKVCVAIFVFLSGYGFSESVKSKNVGLFEFYIKRLVSIYSNYWVIALIFVPIGIYMGRTLQDVFINHAYMKFAIQMTGLHRFAYSQYGYNETWWYMSVIIPLIIIFPFIYDLTKKYGILIPIFFFVILIPNRSFLSVINTWLLPFTLGIYSSQNNYIATISSHLNIYGYWRFIILIAGILLVAIYRDCVPVLGGTKIDWLFGGLIIVFIFELTKVVILVQTFLVFLGKHLFNIFLFHTFIYSYYWGEYIYYFHNPFLIFLALLSVCIAISLVIEQFKSRIYLNRLIEKAKNLQIPSGIEIAFQQNAPADVHTSRCCTSLYPQKGNHEQSFINIHN